MLPQDEKQRHIGLVGATGLGVGAIVGGGILALAGPAFAATGPSALLAFALNGVVALLTALSFAEVASRFPESGGTYTFAKKVLSIEAAFTVGWVVWFASIVAAVLYALGFGEFAAITAKELWLRVGGTPPAWLTGRAGAAALALAAVALYTALLVRRASGGGQWVNVGKLAVFAILIVAGLWALGGRSASEIGQALQPFFSRGAAGLFQAMGFTFIALQGFDLIAAVGGEVRQPERTIPRAMLASLGIALAVYLPLLLIVSTVGVPAGVKIGDASRADPETIIAIAAQRYLGPLGYWLVVVAAMLSMLSALHANLLAASRVAMAMARDRTLARPLARISQSRGTPVPAILTSALLVAAVVLILPGVAAAGAASSLIFLISFALAHWITILVRQRSQHRPPPFRAPLYPLVPVAGGMACVALAAYQGIAVPSAGTITVSWLAIGGLLFLGLFARRARVADASSAALDPELIALRGATPLVLVPIANPESAASLIGVADALAPPQVGRVLLLSVVVAPPRWRPDEDRKPLKNAQDVLGNALAASVEAGLLPEALTTVASQPWPEIARVARAHRCESLLLGLSRLTEEATGSPVDQIISTVDSDIVVLRAEAAWRLSGARRILVPLAGRAVHERLLARLLASIARGGQRSVDFLRVLPEGSSQAERGRAERALRDMAYELWPSTPGIEVATGSEPVKAVAERAVASDLVILGVQRMSRRQKLFGHFTLKLAREISTPMLVISSRG